MILPMTQDTDDFIDTAAEPEAGETGDLSLRCQLLGFDIVYEPGGQL